MKIINRKRKMPLKTKKKKKKKKRTNKKKNKAILRRKSRQKKKEKTLGMATSEDKQLMSRIQGSSRLIIIKSKKLS